MSTWPSFPGEIAINFPVFTKKSHVPVAKLTFLGYVDDHVGLHRGGNLFFVDTSPLIGY
jgi:hypothetical protein